MKQYVTGGAIRDVLLGLKPKDIDFVWTNTSADFLLSKGWSQVGKNFPVFLDNNGQEHALARREKKSGAGYYGFTTETDDVSIEEDLQRRDLTLNSLAVKIENWDEFVKTKNEMLVIDPWNGVADLRAGILRHTSPAYVEDVIRVLRTARFAARYNFKVHPDTIELMHKVAPELVHVPQERIWAEFEKGLMEENPEKMFSVLNKCGALRLLPLQPYNAPQLTALMKAADDNEPLFVRFALVSWGFEDSDYERCRIPQEEAKVSKMFYRYSGQLMSYATRSAEERLDLLESFRALNDPDLLFACIRVLNYLHFDDTDHHVNSFMVIADLDRLDTIDATEIAASCKTGAEIKKKLREARLAVM